MLPLCVALVLGAIGVVAVVTASRRVVVRLGLDPQSTLVWLGLAEWPVGEGRKQRPRLKELFALEA